MLRDQLLGVDQALNNGEQSLTLFERLYEADRDGCQDINTLLSQLEGGVMGVADILDDIERRLNMLESESSQVDNRVNYTLADVRYTVIILLKHVGV